MKITLDMTPDEFKQLINSKTTTPSTPRELFNVDEIGQKLGAIAGQALLKGAIEKFGDEVGQSDTVKDAVQYITNHITDEDADANQMTDMFVSAVSYAVHDIYGKDNEQMNDKLAAWTAETKEDQQ
mgnify:CR=1 FL=1